MTQKEEFKKIRETMTNKTNRPIPDAVLSTLVDVKYEDEEVNVPIAKDFTFHGVTLATDKRGICIFNIISGTEVKIYYDRPSPYIKIFGSDKKQYIITVAEVVLRCWKNYGMQHYLPSVPYHKDGNKSNNHADNLMWMVTPEYKKKILSLNDLIRAKSYNFEVPWCITEEEVCRLYDVVKSGNREDVFKVLKQIRLACQERWTPEFRSAYRKEHGDIPTSVE